MRLYTLILIAMTALLVGCFDTTPPPGVIGDIVGCIEAENSIYCLTEYPVAAISLETIVDDVANNGIRFQQQIVTVTGEATVFTGSITLETGNETIRFWVRDAAAVWKIETGKTYQMTVFIDHIDRDRHEYSLWSYPVTKNSLDQPAVSVNTITAATLADTNNYEYTALYVTGTIERKGDNFVLLTTNTDKVLFAIYSESDPDLLNTYQVGNEYTLPVFVSGIHAPEANVSQYRISCEHIKNY